MRFHPLLLWAFLPWLSHAQTILQPAGAGTYEYFGRSVAIDGDWLLASTYSQGYSGLSGGLYKVHAYKNNQFNIKGHFACYDAKEPHWRYYWLD